MRRTGLVLLIFSTLVAAPAAAEDTLLSATDLRYLKAIGQSQAELKAMQPTQAMLGRLHELINDPATAKKPKAREDAVWRWIDHINAQHVWCTDHPNDNDCGGEKTSSTP